MMGMKGTMTRAAMSGLYHSGAHRLLGVAVRIPNDADARPELVVLVEAVGVIGREARIPLVNQAEWRVRIDGASNAPVKVFTAPAYDVAVPVLRRE